MLGVATVRSFATRAQIAGCLWKGNSAAADAGSLRGVGVFRYQANGSLGNVLPALDPEVQAGYEGGAELYLGHALTLQITRFDQRATGLIQNVVVWNFVRGR